MFLFNNDAFDGFLIDDEHGDEGYWCWFFLCEPNKDSFQHHVKRAGKHLTYPSPRGVDGSRSSVNTGRVPNSTVLLAQANSKPSSQAFVR
mmetsp:Transcript_18093/g.26866  ORF Transcript_18093/g.26866 Transcript_18093/m.26866 type:complete len:90 (+) Transcript_18093:1444-1713(+)